MNHAAADGCTQESHELTGRQRMVVVRRPDGDLVQFLSRQGQMTLSVRLTEQGPVLRFEGASLVLQAAGSLSIEAEDLHFMAALASHSPRMANLALRAAGDLTSEARIQNVTATLGNVNVRANDDVKLRR